MEVVDDDLAVLGVVAALDLVVLRVQQVVDCDDDDRRDLAFVRKIELQ